MKRQRARDPFESNFVQLTLQDCFLDPGGSTVVLAPINECETVGGSIRKTAILSVGLIEAPSEIMAEDSDSVLICSPS